MLAIFEHVKGLIGTFKVVYPFPVQHAYSKLEIRLVSQVLADVLHFSYNTQRVRGKPGQGLAGDYARGTSPVAAPCI